LKFKQTVTITKILFKKNDALSGPVKNMIVEYALNKEDKISFEMQPEEEVYAFNELKNSEPTKVLRLKVDPKDKKDGNYGLSIQV